MRSGVLCRKNACPFRDGGVMTFVSSLVWKSVSGREPEGLASLRLHSHLLSNVDVCVHGVDDVLHWIPHRSPLEYDDHRSCYPDTMVNQIETSLHSCNQGSLPTRELLVLVNKGHYILWFEVTT